MFLDIPEPIKNRMKLLRELDDKHREEEIPPLQRLRQIPAETGRFLAIMAAGSPDGNWIEIGTSGGYSALWLALACRETGRKLTTFEIMDEKYELAKETVRVAEVEEYITLVKGDAKELLEDYKDISFCFLDAEKEVYLECYEKIVPSMVSGGMLVADNVISHKEELKEFNLRALSDERVDSLIVPVGSGVMVGRMM